VRYNALLRGILGALQAKVEGKSPNQLEESIRGVLDVYPFLLAGRREFLAGGTDPTAAASGFFPDITGNLTPKPGELFLVEQFVAYRNTSLAANEYIAFSPAFVGRTVPIGLLHYVMLAPPVGRFVAGDLGSSFAARPFVLVPGDIPGAWVDAVNIAVGTELALSMTFVRCEI